MKGIVLTGFGGPEVMSLAEIPDPVPGEGQVRIRVRATSVNRADLVQREGHYPPPPGESEILGLEAAGDIDALGPGVTGRRPGEKVMTLLPGGGYAEYAVAYADHLMPVPEGMGFFEAACISETYITAFHNIFRLGGLRNGETVLVHGGGGGVNTAAVQICRALVPESTVIVTASTGKVDRVRTLGAHHVIDYRKEDFTAAVESLTGGRGADVILDHIGAPYLAPNLKALGLGGRLVLIGVMGGAVAEVNLARLMVKRQRIIGSVLRSLPVPHKTEIVAEFRDRVLPLFSRGIISPLIHTVRPLADAAEAHRIMAKSAHFGKIVLSVGSDPPS